MPRFITVINEAKWSDTFTCITVVELHGRGSCRLSIEDGNIFIISDVYVNEESRGLGLGRFLILICESLAKDKGASKVLLVINNLSSSIYSWYKDQGFTLDDPNILSRHFPEGVLSKKIK